VDFATTGQALQVAGRKKVEPVTGPATAFRHRLSNARPSEGASHEPHGLGGPPLKMVAGLPAESLDFARPPLSARRVTYRKTCDLLR